ncbi:hypothetical protein EI94DRAFT_1818395 [Lactarius quietus]|nr:hypothetical protein EI94DRAFT_1818395 [Lactarius quietus]
MLFRAIIVVASLTFIAQSALAQLTIPEVIDDINDLAILTTDASTTLESLGPGSNAHEVQLASVNIGIKFNNIIVAMERYISAINGTPGITNCSTAIGISYAMNNYTNYYESFTSEVFSQHTIFAQYILTAPIAALLKHLKTDTDSFITILIAYLTTCYTTNMQTYQNNIDAALKNAISTYDQKCIPSPHYPSLPPICVKRKS